MATFVLVDTTEPRRARFQRGVHQDAASGAHHAIHPVRGRTAAQAVLRAAPAPVAVLDPYARGSLDLPGVSELRRAFPSAGVIAYAAFHEHPVQDLLELAAAGVDSALSSDVDDDVPGVHRAIARALKRHELAAVLAAVERVATHGGYRIVREALRRSERALTVPELAASLGLHHRSLERLARAELLPPPARIISWCRIAHAARLLMDPGRSVEGVARALGFPDGPTLRKLVKRETGLRPRELVQDGTLTAVTAGFAATLRGSALSGRLSRADTEVSRPDMPRRTRRHYRSP